MITKNRNRISGPLLDRIDIHIEVPAVKYKEMAGEATGETSEQVRGRVEQARDVQRKRFKHPNARMTPKQIKEHCRQDDDCHELLKTAMTELNLSARAYDQILKVSRISEAIQYCSLDRQLWV
jgi:magnesium chelatase family protein